MSYLEDEDDVYQEGLISWWRDRRERKKNALNASITQVADEMERSLNVKFSSEYRKYFMEGPLVTSSKILTIYGVGTSGIFTKKASFEYQHDMMSAAKNIQDYDIKCEDKSKLYPIGRVEYYNSPNRIKIDLYSDDVGNVYTPLYSQGMKRYEVSARTLYQFISSFYHERMITGDISYTHSRAYSVNSNRVFNPQHDVDVKINSLNGGVYPSLLAMENTMMKSFPRFLNNNVADAVNHFLKRRMEMIDAMKDAVVSIIKIFTNKDNDNDASEDKNDEKETTSKLTINNIEISFWEVFRIYEREYVYRKNTNDFDMILHCCDVNNMTDDNVIDIYVSSKGNVTDIKIISDSILKRILLELMMYITTKSGQKNKGKTQYTEEADTSVVSSTPSEPSISVPPITSTTSASSDTNTIANDVKSAVNQAIKESTDLVTALEMVGAMYGIPAENIIEDSSLKSIKVVNDNIIAPPLKNPSGNTKAIMCSIGSVLDYISQRIDDKLNNYQANEIHERKRDEAVRREANPAKGTVISRHTDDNGDEIIVYNTGMIDMPNTREAQRKVDELRQNSQIPTYDPSLLKKEPTYFTDEDDITADVDIDTNIDTPETVDVASDIQESYFYLDLVSKFNNTRHLGYDLLKSTGFDYVRPTEVIQESASSKSKKDKTINPEDIKYMKFDNTNVINAINYFNAARAEQPTEGRGNFSIRQFINSENYKKAIDCLNKQFDCHINLRFINEPHESDDLFTSIYNNIKQNFSISKSKGFQLNGLPIDIFAINKAFDGEASNDITLFGQSVVSGILHEIFHNIASAIRFQNGEFTVALSSTIAMASAQPDAKRRRVIITNYVNTLNEFYGKKLNRFNKRLLIKQLLTITALQHNENMINEIKHKIESSGGNPNADIDELIKKYQKYVKKYEKSKKRSESKFWKVLTVVGRVIGGILMASGVGIPIALCLFYALQPWYDKKQMEKFRSEKHMEEYYCDLFAGMYKLPVTFFLGLPDNRKFVANQISPDKLKTLTELEKKLYEFTYSEYPTFMERNYAAVKIAKNLLDSKEKLDPAIKKYLEWIVENYSSMLDTNIDEIYNDNTFDPKSADDLDEHIQNLINNNNITLTESDISWIFDDSNLFTESFEYEDSIDDDILMEADELKEIDWLIDVYNRSLMIMETCGYDPFDVFMEADVNAKSDTPIIGSKGENIFKRIIMVIPRLISKIVAIIQRAISKKIHGEAITNINLEMVDQYVSKISKLADDINDYISSDGGKIPSSLQNGTIEITIKEFEKLIKSPESFKQGDRTKIGPSYYDAQKMFKNTAKAMLDNSAKVEKMGKKLMNMGSAPQDTSSPEYTIYYNIRTLIMTIVNFYKTLYSIFSEPNKYLMEHKSTNRESKSKGESV